MAQTWPVTKTSHSLQGLGYQSSPDISTNELVLKSPEGLTGRFTPYVLPLPVNLWGREVLSDLGLTLTNDYSPHLREVMEKMGYCEGQGLGRYAQGNP